MFPLVLQVFYRAHVIGAVIFTVFGVVHLSNVWEYLSAGLLVYGIDVAYRCLQTSTPVAVSLSAGGNIVNVTVPLEVCSVLPVHKYTGTDQCSTSRRDFSIWHPENSPNKS